MHCQFPMCAAVCPVEAITKFEEGPVVINKETCIGCKYCVYACPWDVIAFDEGSGKATKCTMCNDRITEGKEPFCVKICPADALHFGTYDNMLATAESRATSTGGFVYGKNDAGGTNVLYVLKPGLEKLLPNVPLEKFPRKKRPLSIDIMGILTKGGPRGKIRAIMSILRNPRRLKHRYF